MAIVGASGTGKTSLLRSTFAAIGVEPRWTTARAVVDELVDAIRGDRIVQVRHAFLEDPRPLVVEHLEDLRRLARTQHELQRLAEARVAAGRAVVLTLTADRRTRDVAAWLRRFADVVEVTTGVR